MGTRRPACALPLRAPHARRGRLTQQTLRVALAKSCRERNAFVRAAPLLGSATNVSLHCYVDHSYVTAIFNDQVAFTVVVEPSSAAQALVEAWNEGAAGAAVAELTAWPLKPANNLDVQPI